MVVFAALVLGLAGCAGIIERRAADSTYGVMKRSRVAVQRSADVELARAAAPGGLVQLEAFHLAYPYHRGFKLLLAEGYCQFAAGFLNDDWERATLAGDAAASAVIKERALGLLDKCVGYGLTLLGASWEQAYEAGPGALTKLVARARKSHVAGMTWVALGISTGIAMEPTSPKRLRYLPVAQAMLARAIELDPTFRDATAHVMMGALDSARPRWLGGDPASGKRHFDQARALTDGAALMVDVVFARTYAVAVGDRTLFRATLDKVLAADVGKWPERRLANEMARDKAALYLEHEDALFGKRAAREDTPQGGRDELANGTTE